MRDDNLPAALPASLAAIDRAPINGAALATDPAGKPDQHSTSPLDTMYLAPAPASCSTGMIPPEEVQLRAAFVEAEYSVAMCAEVNVLERLLQPGAYARRAATATDKVHSLKTLAGSSPEHRAAYLRIASTLPAGHALKDLLTPDAVANTLDLRRVNDDPKARTSRFRA
jgi:hypothetical protein